jgi:hypothetical protein
MLSQETTPTLGSALPAFEAMSDVWRKCQQTYPEMYDAIEEGLDKLEQYVNRTDLIPAHVLAMSASSVFFLPLIYLVFAVVEPSIRLDWFEEWRSQRVAHAREIFIEAVRCHINGKCMLTTILLAPRLPAQ